MAATTMRGVPLAVVLAFAVLLAACGDDDGSTSDTTAPAGDLPVTEDVPCPFTADELSEALGAAVEGEDVPVGTPAPVSCAFAVDGGADVLVGPPVGDGRSPEERFEDFEGSFGVEALPELGDTAFVRLSESSSTPESDDVIYDAEIHVELDGAPTVISVLGSSGEDGREADVAAIVTMLDG